jgi:hypothetical protein
MVQPFQVAALAFPISDGVIDEIQLRKSAEILNRKHGAEDGLEACVFALARQQIHLQESLIGIALNFDQVRDINRALDFREIQALAFTMVMIARLHSFLPHAHAGVRDAKTAGRARALSLPRDRTACRPGRTRRYEGSSVAAWKTRNANPSAAALPHAAEESPVKNRNPVT